MWFHGRKNVEDSAKNTQESLMDYFSGRYELLNEYNMVRRKSSFSMK